MTGKNGETILSLNCLRPTRSPLPKTCPRQTWRPTTRLYFLAGAGFACLAVLAWLVAAGPGYMGYGASLLWTGPKAGPLYDIRVTPGDVAVRRNSDQLVTAQVIGLKAGEGAAICALSKRAQSGLGAGCNATRGRSRDTRKFQLPVPLRRPS